MNVAGNWKREGVPRKNPVKGLIHQEFQVPKIEVLNMKRLFWGWVFPYISRIHTAYIGEYLQFRYLKCLVINHYVYIYSMANQPLPLV